MNPDLSFALRNHNHDDPALIRSVIRELYAPVTLLAAGLAPDPGDLEALRIQVFTEAVRELARFPAGTNFYTWFLGAAIHQMRKFIGHQRRSWFSPAGQAISEPASGAPEAQIDDHRPPPAAFWPPDWPDLRAEDKIILVLRYLLGIAVADISEILGLREGRILKSLDGSISIISTLDAEIQRPRRRRAAKPPHKPTRYLLLARETLAETDRHSIEAHLAECAACRSYADGLDLVSLTMTRTRHRILEKIVQAEIETLAKNVLENLKGREHRTRLGAAVREISWILLAVPTILVIGWLFSRANARAEVRKAAEARELAAANEPVEDIPEQTLSIIGSQDMEQYILPLGAVESSWSPKISEDGRWIVYASTIHRLVDDDTNNASDIFVHDRLTGLIERVSIDTEGNQANNSNFEPDISADGRFVVYTSWANNLAANDSLHCELWDTQSSCPDIFLRDRQLGETLLVSHNLAGQPGNNFSFSPSISADGRWVAFWSLASDLVQEDLTVCEGRSGTRNCVDVYLYDRVQNRLRRIPVGRDIDDPTPKNHDLVLSGDGQEMLLMIDADDQIARELHFNSGFEIFLYRPETEAFEPLNVSPEGQPGNEPAYAASLSSDGRWAAFATRASNLIAGDSNGMIDIYLRDLHTGEVERIGQPADGLESDGNSGVPAGYGGNFSEGLSLSGDGRWLSFSSVASNLLPEQQKSSCSIFSPICQNVFMAERSTGKILQINSTNVAWVSFTSISGDGRWLAFVADSNKCNPNDFCSEIYLFDRESGSVGALDSFGIGHADPAPMPRIIDGILTAGRHQAWATSVAFSPSGNLLVSGARDGSVSLWSPDGGEHLGSIEGQTSGITSLAFSPDGATLAAGTLPGRVLLWRMPPGNLIGRIDGLSEVRDLAYSPTGDRLFLSTPEGVQVWDVQNSEFVMTLGDKGTKPRGIDISRDGTLVAVASDDHTVRIFSLETGRPLLRLGGHDAGVNAVAISPNGEMLASAGDDGRVNVWIFNAQPGGPQLADLRYRFLHDDWVSSVIFSEDGNLLATGSYDSKAAVWDLQTGGLLDVPFSSAQNQVLDLAISPDGQTLAISTVRGEIVLWVELGQTGG